MESKLLKSLMFRREYDGAQDHDLVLRAYAHKREEQRIGHIGKVLYHWRCHEASTAANPQSKGYAYLAGKHASHDYLKSAGIEAQVTDTRHNGFYRVEYGKQNHIGEATLSKRPDIGVVAGFVYHKNKITGGMIDEKGKCPYFGMNRNFSGYMHKAAMQQDCYAADIRNMMIRTEFIEDFVAIVTKYKKLKYDLIKYNNLNSFVFVTDLLNCDLLSEEEIIDISIAFSKIVHEKGLLVFFDPQFDSRREIIEKNSTDEQNSIDVAVIIPNYNGEKYLKDCLDSLKKCDGADQFQIIVVDNGSSDGSVSLLKENYKDIKLIELKENTGFSGAVNVGIRSAKTEYVILLNNDTTVHKEFIISLVSAMKKNPRLFSVSAKMLSMNDPKKIDGAGDLYCSLGWAFALGKGKNADKYCNKERSVFSACAGAAIYRTNVFEKIGYFDENHFAYLEDVDIGYRARICGYTNRYEPSAICYHAGSGFSGSRYNEFKINLSSKNSIYLIYKNMPFLQLLINLPFLLIGFMIKILFFVRIGYGLVYCKGLYKGLSFCFTKDARKNKVHFRFKNLFHYFSIQIGLWWNMLRRFLI